MQCKLLSLVSGIILQACFITYNVARVNICDLRSEIRVIFHYIDHDTLWGAGAGHSHTMNIQYISVYLTGPFV